MPGLSWVRDLVVGDVMVGDVMVDRSVRVEWTPALERERTSIFAEAAAAGPAQREREIRGPRRTRRSPPEGTRRPNEGRDSEKDARQCPLAKGAMRRVRRKILGRSSETR